MEISEAYRFCPVCGTKREKLAPARPFRCGACGHTSFFGPVTAVGTVITNKLGQVLLIERAKEPGLGKLGLPGGFVDPGEGAELAARREIKEEIGISVGAMRYIMTAPNSYTYHGIVLPVLDIFFCANITDEREILHDESEVSSWMWVHLSPEILERMAFPSNRQALESFLDQSRTVVLNCSGVQANSAPTTSPSSLHRNGK